MRIMLVMLISLTLFFSTAYAEAPNKEVLQNELIEANDIIIAAGICNLAYGNRISSKILDLFEHRNFDVEQYSIKNTIVDSQMILTRYYSNLTQKAMYIITFRGSNNKKDWNINFKYGQVPYDSSVKLLPEQEVPKDIPLVHNGFNEYVNIALQTQDSAGTPITELLIKDKDADVLVTGHSLGGAVAILYAARLVDMGLDADRLQVITFGSPAVSNKIFANLYQDKLKLVRLVTNQDLIPTALKSVGNYVQFGKEIKLPADPRKFDYFDQHDQNFYLHQAIKYYYDTEDKAIAAGVAQGNPLTNIVPGKALIAIHSSSTPEAKKLTDFKYMPRVVADQLHAMLPSYTTIPAKDPSDDAKVNFGVLPEFIADAQKDGAKLLLLTQLDIANYKEKDYKSVVLNYLIIDVDTQRTIAAASISSSLKARNSMLQTLLFDISQIPFDILR